jgi:hypothetical protein
MNLFDPAFAPFTIALLVMLFMAILEVGSLAFGASLSGMLDDAFDGPDTDMPDANPGLLDSFFGWLGVGRVPAMILLAALLLCFGVIGMTLQHLWHGVFNAYLPSLFVAVIAAPLALFPTRWIGRLVQRFLPKEESDAVSTETFIGKVAIILRGEAASGRPAEAKLKDQHGSSHYLLVEPDDADARFAAGAEVLIVAKTGAVFRAIINPSAALTAG